MSKGDFLEPLFKFTARIFFPRVGARNIIESLSWPWLGALILSGIAYMSIRQYIRETETLHGSESAKSIRQKLRTSRYALWAMLFLSLLMFRFGNGL